MTSLVLYEEPNAQPVQQVMVFIGFAFWDAQHGGWYIIWFPATWVAAPQPQPPQPGPGGEDPSGSGSVMPDPGSFEPAPGPGTDDASFQPAGSGAEKDMPSIPRRIAYDRFRTIPAQAPFAARERSA